MKFSEMPYERPNIEKAADVLTQLAQSAKSAKSEQELLACYEQASVIFEQVGTAGTVASVRHTVDTRDAYYNDENDYFDEQGPVLEDKRLLLYRSLLASEHSDALGKKYGEILPQKMALAIKGSDERLIQLQQEENALCTLYEKLYASARIPFRGEVLTVAQLGPHKQDVSRDVRKEAFEAEGGFFEQNKEELNGIFSRLVRNRTAQAKMLGYENFVPLGDIRMERMGYTRADIERCRQDVAKYIVPIAQKLKQEQAERIGEDALKYWDELLLFGDGNPRPHGEAQRLLQAGQEMYRQMSPQSAEFIDFMMQNELFDVLAKPGKAPGGYCTYISGNKSPFVFSNFNGTLGDVDVLTHEAGHAFAAYLAAQSGLVSELRSPGLESCEIHSTAMEFLTGEHHHLFFGQDTKKYTIAHLQDALCFLPYGCMVDEFQQMVYEAPEMSEEERCAAWLSLEKKYRPWADFDALPFYSRGAGWQRQLHIYVSPFYYIDYVLAQIVALQFLLAHNEDKKDAWERYLALVQKAGTSTYTGLVQAAGLQTPFEEGCVKHVGEESYKWLRAQL